MEQKPSSKKKQRYNDYARFSGMAIQMGAIIALGTWGGTKLDAYFVMKKFPVFTITLSLLSVFAAMYFVIRSLGKKK